MKNELRIQDRNIERLNPITSRWGEIAKVDLDGEGFWAWLIDVEGDDYEIDPTTDYSQLMERVDEKFELLRSYCSDCGEAVSDKDRAKADEVDQVYRCARHAGI